MKKIKSLYIFITIGIVLTMFLASSASFLLGYWIGAMVHDPYIQEAKEILEEEDITEDSEEQIDEEVITTEDDIVDTFEIPILNTSLSLFVTAPISGCSDATYQLTSGTLGDSRLAYEDIDENNEYCKGTYMFSFFDSMDSFLTFYEPEYGYSEDEVTVNGTTFKYIYRFGTETEEEGFLYQTDSTVKVKGYDAFKTLSYMYYYQEGEYTNTNDAIAKATTKVNNCVFDISKVDSRVSGILFFTGGSQPGTIIDYCEVLDTNESFSLVIK